MLTGMPTSTLSSLVASTPITSSWPAWPRHLPSPVLLIHCHCTSTPSVSADRSLPAPLPPRHYHSHPGNTQKTLSWLPSLSPSNQSSSPANFSKDEAAKGTAETQTQGPQAGLTLVL